MNSVVLVGNLARDPELRFTAGSGKAVATFSLAVNRPFAKEGQQSADFLRIVVFGKSAENCANYLSKGSKVAIQGRIQTGSYETSTGERRYTTDIVAERVEFLNRANRDNQGGFGQDNFNGGFNDNPEGFQALDDDDDDIPF
ncbi:MAG: single-stranded DNA-binding protein [Anaeromicrobium sp.]|jgi:single-strand DNA-binding protein|uniref:single-stranded DNA-binding protein n=1 Tax=Anaeromicrobium sp. TaxID=1929132 RepID=UPI0025CFEEA7|nr:single-stranded DNA-binding protein [Anaeromicrobium sp.]MCT4595236.1 single-stranded DNA-binding protein [Anaeromicrobium sp.]